MKAVVIHAARDLRVEDREPETPGPGQVKVAIEAGGICGSDLHYFNHGGFGSCTTSTFADRLPIKFIMPPHTARPTIAIAIHRLNK
jgi:NADPH:quinone reductase-like Zn-dependent oxidoreductase